MSFPCLNPQVASFYSLNKIHTPYLGFQDPTDLISTHFSDHISFHCLYAQHCFTASGSPASDVLPSFALGHSLSFKSQFKGHLLRQGFSDYQPTTQLVANPSHYFIFPSSHCYLIFSFVCCLPFPTTNQNTSSMRKGSCFFISLAPRTVLGILKVLNKCVG